MAALLVFLTIGLPWLGALVVLLAGEGYPRARTLLAAGFAAVSALCATALLPFAAPDAAVQWSAQGSAGVFGASGAFSFVADGLGIFLAMIATIIGSLCIVFSFDYMHGKPQQSRYYALVLLFIGAMAGLVLSDSLLLLFFFWELVALCSCALIAFENDNPQAVAGGVRALVITQIGGVGLLAGALLAYGTLGSFQISALLAEADRLPSAVLASVAFGFLIAAAAKSAQVPFHSWLPGAMEAPTSISALIHAATMVNAGVYLLARFYPAFESVSGWKEAVILVGALSALLAALMALFATDLKRALAYSTISQLGYMVYAVGVGAIFASQFHLLSHAVFKALLFLSAGAVIHAVNTRNLHLMGGLGKTMPFTRNAFTIGALALAGLPILSGFWSKELVLEAGLAHGGGLAYAVMLFSAGLTALYSLRLVWLVFYGEPRGAAHAHDAAAAMRAALVPLVVGALAIWLLAGPFSALLAQTLPFHKLHPESTGDVIGAVLGDAATALALAVVGLGIAAWKWRDRLVKMSSSLVLDQLSRAASADFGFMRINRTVTAATLRAASALRLTQTGQLNWNMVGVVAGLIVVLIILAVGGGGGTP